MAAGTVRNGKLLLVLVEAALQLHARLEEQRF